MNHNFKELRIWQKRIDLVDASYDFAATLSKEEKYNLISQITKRACSVPSVIAERCGKRTPNLFAECLSTSLGSCFELETQIIICERRNFGKPGLRKDLVEKLNELKNMIFNLKERIVNGGKS